MGQESCVKEFCHNLYSVTKIWRKIDAIIGQLLHASMNFLVHRSNILNFPGNLKQKDPLATQLKFPRSHNRLANL